MNTKLKILTTLTFSVPFLASADYKLCMDAAKATAALEFDAAKAEKLRSAQSALYLELETELNAVANELLKDKSFLKMINGVTEENAKATWEQLREHKILEKVRKSGDYYYSKDGSGVHLGLSSEKFSLEMCKIKDDVYSVKKPEEKKKEHHFGIRACSKLLLLPEVQDDGSKITVYDIAVLKRYSDIKPYEKSFLGTTHTYTIFDSVKPKDEYVNERVIDICGYIPKDDKSNVNDVERSLYEEKYNPFSRPKPKKPKPSGTGQGT